MLKNWQSILGLSSLVLSCVSSINSKAMPSAKASLIANEIELKSPKRNPNQSEILFKQLQQNLSAPPLGQINSVSQLRDVSPEDWAYEALRGLTERFLMQSLMGETPKTALHRYGCIAGIENATYRGDRAITRYEFAAGLNSCLQQIEQLIARSETISVEDLQTIQQLSQEFAAQLTTIGTELNELENRTAFLEDKQFSTTTKLVGEAVFSFSGAFGEDKANSSEEDIEDEIVFNNRVRLNFNSSFTGKDLLKVR